MDLQRAADCLAEDKTPPYDPLLGMNKQAQEKKTKKTKKQAIIDRVWNTGGNSVEDITVVIA